MWSSNSDCYWHLQKMKKNKNKNKKQTTKILFQTAKTFPFVWNVNENLLKVLLEFLPHLIQRQCNIYGHKTILYVAQNLRNLSVNLQLHNGHYLKLLH